MFRSNGQSPRRLLGKLSGSLPPAPVHFSLGAETIRAGPAPGGPLAGGSKSSLLRFFLSFFAGLSRRRPRFSLRRVSPALREIDIILFISTHNLLHQVVPTNVFLAELN